jgi:hypothetical protein
MVVEPAGSNCATGGYKLVFYHDLNGTQTLDTAAELSGALNAYACNGATGITGYGATGATGADGATGATGSMGATGVAGATGAGGATGTAGPDGATGGVGATGATGATGQDIAGATGATGAAGATGATGATGAVDFVVWDACGATGASPCIVGTTGPAGGIIVFVDYDNVYPDFEYLEAGPSVLGPTGATGVFLGPGGATLSSGPTASKSFLPSVSACYSSSGGTGVDCAPSGTPSSTLYSSNYAAQEIASTAVGMGATNTALIYSLLGATGANVDNTTYWAGIVRNYLTLGPTGVYYQDWFIPSLGEFRIMATALSQLGRHSAWNSTNYVTSSEASLSNVWAFAPGTVSIPAQQLKSYTTTFNVRPMRMFSRP